MPQLTHRVTVHVASSCYDPRAVRRACPRAAPRSHAPALAYARYGGDADRRLFGVLISAFGVVAFARRAPLPHQPIRLAARCALPARDSSSFLPTALTGLRLRRFTIVVE